jgi:hypothetical protein
MGVPQFLLLIRQSIEKLLGDDVLDADEASIRLRTIEDGALSHVLVVVHAVVVRLHLLAHVVRIKMESTYMAVDPVDGLEALELQLQSTQRDGSVNEKWLLLFSLFVVVICIAD